MLFKEVYEFFSIFGILFKFLFKLLLFVLLWTAPFGVIYIVSLYLSEKFGIAYQLIIAACSFIIAMIALAYCCKIWVRTDLTRGQKWALMNGKDIDSPPKVKSESEIYKDLFDEAERNLKWKKK